MGAGPDYSRSAVMSIQRHLTRLLSTGNFTGGCVFSPESVNRALPCWFFECINARQTRIRGEEPLEDTYSACGMFLIYILIKKKKRTTPNDCNSAPVSGRTLIITIKVWANKHHRMLAEFLPGGRLQATNCEQSCTFNFSKARGQKHTSCFTYTVSCHVIKSNT